MTPPGSGTLRSINVYLRKSLDLYANIRPFTSYRGISLHEGFNFVIVRENTEGLYAGIEGRFKNQAFSVKAVSREGSERIVRLAVDYARSRGYRKLTVVHKANILKESDGLFREVFWEVVNGYEGLISEELFVDAAAYWMVKDPKRFQVIVTPNLYGDILSDLAAGLTGSLGLCGSAQIGEGVAVFEPVHGTAPDIAGKGVANPLSAIMSSALMLEYLGTRHSDPAALNASEKIRRAVKSLVEAGEVLTPDLGGSSRTSDVGDALVRKLTGS
jgi:isocitrate dehydrogenase (NAD+)